MLNTMVALAHVVLLEKEDDTYVYNIRIIATHVNIIIIILYICINSVDKN